jgi:hypothetical protein
MVPLSCHLIRLNGFLTFGVKSYIESSAVDPDPVGLKTYGSGSVIICSAPDLNPEPIFVSSIKRKKNLDFYCFVTSLRRFIIED